LIARKLPDGKYESIYCHWDGYPEHNGVILEKYYMADDKIDALFRLLGDLSILGEEIGEKHDFNDQNTHVCTAYGRDRGEKNVESCISLDRKHLMTRANQCDAEYIYIWDGGKWETIEVT
jgi:hypothetical protein